MWLGQLDRGVNLMRLPEILGSDMLVYDKVANPMTEQFRPNTLHHYAEDY
jgi:hypothetical protein